MATFPSGGDSTAGQFVAAVYETQFEIAEDRLERSDQLTTDAINYLVNAPQIGEVDIDAALAIPEAPEIEGFSPAEMTALYQSTADEIQAMLADGLSTFLTTYFPLGNELAAARAWVENAITNGGTGIAAAVEAQIWERDRSRILTDAARATSEVVSSWAAKGYPLPPGALVGQVADIDQDARNKNAAASRDVAIKQAEIEIENVKFAVDKAIQLRSAAIAAAGDYIRTLALGPQLGVQLSSAMIDAKAKLANVLTSFFQAKINALELPARVAIAQAGLNVDVRKGNLGSQVELIRARVATIESAAKAVGVQASAALNALNASSGFSGSEQV